MAILGMGLLLGAAIPVFAGCHSILLDPVAFILKPLRWLQAGFTRPI